MSFETPTVILSSKASSRTNSSSCVNGSQSPDSLHSLIDGEADKMDKSCNPRADTKVKKKKSVCFSALGQLVWGVILVITSVIGFIITPFDVLLWERLNMRPGFPPYDWWADPPDEVIMRAHIFNITNHERFLNGSDAKINMKEIGPLVYLEKLKHYNIHFNPNSTMTYTAERYLIFLPEKNSIDFNQTVIVPNIALLGIASYLHDANYFVRTGFKLLVNTHGSEVFVKKTIYEYLWDYRESILETSRTLAPSMVPTTNMGMLSRIYADFIDEVTVKIGPKWGHNSFFQIDKVRGVSHITGYDPDKCPDRLTGATEGVLYHQHLSKDEELYCLRKTVCKLVPLRFEKEDVMRGVQVYKYNLPENVFNRVNGTDCYATDKKPLPDGMSDASKCFYDFPMVASFPHFYTGSPPPDTYVTGLKPDPIKHSSYIYVEPYTGIPYKAVARLQCNLNIQDLSGFYLPNLNKFSNLILPLGWIEYNQEHLPTHVHYMIYFIMVILPPLSIILFITTLITGFYLIIKQIYKHRMKREILPSIIEYKNKKVDNLKRNTIFSYEKESFLRNSTDS